jgi:hypothetical protein
MREAGESERDEGFITACKRREFPYFIFHQAGPAGLLKEN